MKRMIRILVDAAFLLLGSTLAAEAAPVVGLVGVFASWLGGGTVASLVGGALLKIGIGAGLGYLAQSLFGKKKEVGGAGGMSGKMQSGGAIPRSFILGRAATAGSLVYMNTWGEDGKTPNAFLHMVISLSDLPVKGLAELWVGSSKVTWDPATPSGVQRAIPEYNDDGDRLWVRFYDGNQTAADAQMVARFAGSARPYRSTRVGTGVAYVVIVARVSDKLWSGWPQFRFVLDGISVYDVRRDSAMGGSGTQVWGDIATYTPASRNLALMGYNVIRGITYKGKWVFGGQTVSGVQVPISSWAAALNECDLSAPGGGSGSEPQYYGGAEVSFDTEPADLLAELFKGCNGRLAEIGGVYKPHVGAPGLSVYHFTDDDILSTDPQTFEPFPSLADVINAVTAKYVEPKEGWNIKDAPPLYSTLFEQQDDGRRQVSDVSYGVVSSGTQVQRLMASALAEARRFREHALPMPPDAFPVEPLDFVSWTSARNGYTNKLFRADAVQDLANLNVGWNITEVDPSDYNPIALKPIETGPTEVVRPAAQPILDWNVAATTITGDGGGMRAGIRLSWDPRIDDVDGVQFEVRLEVDGTMVLQDQTDRFDAGALIISQNILGRTRYEVRGRYRPSSPRAMAWSSWRPVLTPDISEGLTQQQAYELALNTNDARGSMAELRRQLDALIDQVAHDGAENVGADYIQRAAIRDNLSAAIQQITEAYVSGDAAVAQQVTAINTKADQMSAGGFVKFGATAAPSGVSARFEVLLNAGTEGTPNWKEGGFFLDLVGGVVRCFFKVDQFVVGDATSSVIPFSILDGRVLMREALLQSSNSVVKLDLRNDSIIFSEP